MKMALSRLAVAFACVLGLSLPGLAGQLDDYYLAAFNEQSSSALEKAILSTATETAGAVQCGTPLKHGLSRDWNLLESATRQVLAKQLAAPTLTGEATILSSGGHFLIHYATSGSDVPTPATGYTITSWVQAVADTFENVYAVYMTTDGYHPPPGTPYHIYLRSLAALRIYGQTTSTSSSPATGFAYAYGSYIEIDKDFTSSVFHPLVYTPLQSLQITAAHEYHHAIQYGYNFFFDIWYAEATSTWYEDELYDNVNQLYAYLDATLLNTNLSLDIAADTTTGGGYGRWLFNRHLAEAHGGQSMVRGIWERLAATTPAGQSDIPMAAIIDTSLQASGSSLATDFLGYAGKLYTGAWSTHPSEVRLIPTPTMTGTFTSYPVTVTSVPSPSITLPHYSFAFFRMVPSATSPATLTITLTADAGISAVAFRKTGSSIASFTPGSGSNVITIPGFGTATEVVLLLANTTGSDNLFAGFSSDGTQITYALPGTTILSATAATAPAAVTLSWAAVTGATSYRIYRSSSSSTSLALYKETSATSFTDSDVVVDHTYYYAVLPATTAGLTGPASQVASVTVSTPPATSSGGGGGGCFIATAAYGSYLHPQVRILREFRDRYLLTNAPGRAFVGLYYRLSPPLADVIARHETLRWAARLVLTPVVMAVVHPVAMAAALMMAAALSIPLRRRYRRIFQPVWH
ncbi:MXAN_6640 family putative metalloprotease [Geobacter sp. FeAm09]|uniref:MXAN_6640 family putative metalloprotease n=1 Tax=Geobacter sp. FeAm09 TaxID=2597769 RepID=UPI00197A7C34|nr:MXAN_6640 family putative metalloprotease [Geobacter sp. FeAm09]